MNKAQLTVIVSEKCNLTKRCAEKTVDCLFDEIQACLLKGDVVKISNFGVFQPKTKKERIGTSPVNGKKITIPATKTVCFKPSRNLKDLLK